MHDCLFLNSELSKPVMVVGTACFLTHYFYENLGYSNSYKWFAPFNSFLASTIGESLKAIQCIHIHAHQCQSLHWIWDLSVTKQRNGSHSLVLYVNLYICPLYVCMI
jgi:hypothetical protein